MEPQGGNAYKTIAHMPADRHSDSERMQTQKASCRVRADDPTGKHRSHGIHSGNGLNFDRPSFNRMLDDIEAGKIDVVITKDLSRLGRDHLKVGHFTEIYFPMKNVRYIAVNDGVDTANKNNDIAALKNVMNEFYSRDNSRKIRSSIRARAKAGLYRSSFNPIGYRKSPDNHNRLIVDEETAWIVKRIFELANAGMGAHKIATVFREEQVPCPSWWLHSRGEKDYSKRFENPENKYEWSHTVIRNIISNPLYLGHCVMCKTESIFKVNASKKVPKEDWITVENTHEPLVTQEVFDGANEKILSRRRDTTDNFVSPFAGLVKCGTCGKALGLRYWTGKSMPLELFIVFSVVQSVDILLVPVDQFMKVLPIHKLSSSSFISYHYYSISCRNFNLCKHMAYISLVFISSLKHIERSFCQNIQFFI